MLLSFPSELVQQILQSCDSSSFIQVAFCCHSLLALASSSRRLVLHQLNQLPGRPDDWDSLTTTELFRVLVRRSREVLIGADFHSESKLFTFQGKVIDTRASTLKELGTQKEALLVFKNDPTVYLIHIQNGAMTLLRKFAPPAAELGQVEVLHTAFDSRAIYVLHRVRPIFDQGLDPKHPFVKQALQSNPRGNIFLAHHGIKSKKGPVKVYGFPDQHDHEPLCFAAYKERFAISWQHVQRGHDHEVVLYTMENYGYEMDPEKTETGGLRDDSHKPMKGHSKNPPILDSRYFSYALIDSNEESRNDNVPSVPTVRLAFNDKGAQLLHYYGAQTLHSSFQRIHSLPPSGQERPSIYPNGCVVGFTNTLSLRFSIGIPFFSTHQEGDVTLGLRCHWKYLAVAIATHRVEGWSVACLLRSEGSPLARRCDHQVNLDRGRRFEDWQVMAQLGGFQEMSTSRGSLIATSCGGTRIAMVSWKTVTIWVLEPHSLIEDDCDFYPYSWISIEGNIVLRPITIELDAVCCQLQFTDNENELVAITDRGVLFLHLKANGRGIQQVNHHGNDILGITR